METPGGCAAVFAVCATFEDTARVDSQIESMPGRISPPPARADCLPRGAVARTGVNVLRQALRS